MKYALIQNTLKIITVKEVELDMVTLKIIITSMKDEVYDEQYESQNELLDRLIVLNGGFNSSSIREWFNKTDYSG